VIVETFVALSAFLMGAVIGSFLNVCIARWPRDLSVLRPRSKCLSCGHQLSWFENIPLVSWLAPWMMCAWQFGATFTALRVAVFFTILLGIAVTDVKHYLIPDGFTVFGLLWMLLTSVVGLYLLEQAPFVGPYDALVGACAGAGLIAIVGWLGEVTLKREAMGMGDVTLMAFVGAALGPSRAIVTVFAGALLGAVTFVAIVYPVARARQSALRGTEQTELALGSGHFEAPLVPFGVFLAPAALVTLLWGDTMLAWLLRS
jgi:leader peptidase (prepilin peptidase)/N-methyltransferase